MRRIRLLVSATLALCWFAWPVLAARAAAHFQPYHFIKAIKVGGNGFWDYLTLDPEARLLYVAHASKVDVINVDRGTVVGTIPGLPGVHGFAIVPPLDLGFASDGSESKAAIVDLKTLKVISKVDTGAGPDAILFEPGREQVYTFNGRGNSATVFEPETGKVIATVVLPGKPEFAAADPRVGRVYVNIEDKDEIAVIDTSTHRVVEDWPIAPGSSASGMAIDLLHHRLFIGCHNKLMEMIDSRSGRVVATVPIGRGVDANRYDSLLKLAFSSNGEGTVTIAREETPQRLQVLQNLKTLAGARTMALDSKTHRIYLATADFAPRPAAAGSRHRPRIVPGSFRILVYGPGK